MDINLHKYNYIKRQNFFKFQFFTFSIRIINSLPKDKIVDWSKLKAFADDKIKVLKMMTIVFNRVENIVGKGENAGFQHFLLLPQCFQKAFYSGSLKVGIVW